MKRHVIWFAVLCLILASCTWNEAKRKATDAKNFVFDTNPTTKKLTEEDSTPIIELNEDAAKDLAKDLAKDVPKGSVIFYERFVNQVDGADSAPFGMVVAQQVANRLAQLDYLVSTAKPRTAPAAPPAPPGQEPKEAPPRPCHMTGSYMIGDDVIYLHSRVVTLDNGAQVAGYSWTLPINRNTRALLPRLNQGGMSPTVRTSF